MKAAALIISQGVLVEICKGLRDGFVGGFEVTANPLPADALPADALPVMASIIDEHGTISILVQSAAFEDVPDGERFPVLPPVGITARPW